ncbi:hypothetical protein HK098_007523, partial [Nowakowskiella sp. JEL0407]
RTDEVNAKLLFTEFRVDRKKNTAVFLDNVELSLGSDWKEQFLDALRGSRVCVPIISNRFMKDLDVKEGQVDNVLLEWDTILESCDNGSGQLIIPVFVEDETGAFDFKDADAAMKDVKAKSCKRTAREIWDLFKRNQGEKVDLRDLYQVKLFVRNVQDRVSEVTNSSLGQPAQKRRPIQFNLYAKDDPQIFIDCSKVIGEIDEILEHGNMCNLRGLGGSGKTFVANKYAFLMLARGYIVAKFTADTEADLIRDFSEYLMKLLKVDKLPVRGGRICDYLQYASECNLPKQFIILDNVKQFSDIEDFRHSWDKDTNVKYLITSRTFISEPAIIKDFYSEYACIEYLKKETKRGFNEKQCKNIYEITNGFPLRLAIAARYLRDPTESLADYITNIEKKKKQMKFTFNPEKLATDDVDEIYPEVSLSIDKLTEKVSYAYMYLVLLSGLQPDLISEKYLMESFEEYQRKYREFQKKHMVQRLTTKFKNIVGSNTDIMALTRVKVEESRKVALKLGIVENAHTLSDPENEAESAVAIKIHRCVQAEVRDRVRKKSSTETSVSEIAQLYDKRTKSYDTLCSELKAGMVDNALVLLQKWSSCELNVHEYILSIGDLETLGKALSRNTSVKNLKLEWLY